MRERFTIDVIADELGRGMLSGTPSRRLLHRFFRRGKRDGKRAHDHESMATLVREAVRLASSGLCKEYVVKRDQAARELAVLRAAVNRATALEMEPLAQENPRGQIFTSESPTLDHSLPIHDLDSDQQLHAALLRRRALVKHRAEIAAARASEEHRAATAADLQRVRAEGEAARGRLAQETAGSRQLRAEYVERFGAVANAGNLLWARYCNGFEEGHTTRRSRGSNVRPPRHALDMALPPALLEDSVPPDPLSSPHELARIEV